MNLVRKTKNMSIIDLRKTTNHPISFLYSEIFNNALLDSRIAYGRSQPGFSLDKNSNSIFVIAAKKAVEFGLQKKGIEEYLKSIYSKYYELVVPHNAADWLGLDFSKNSVFYSEPPWSAVFPWRARSVESYKNAYVKAAIKENEVLGKNLTIKDGWLFCGPVSAEKLEIEVERILYVLRSIQKNGYQRDSSSDGDAKATALVNTDGDWRWLLTAGNHRASAAAALGYDSIPIRVNLVIIRDQVKFWPHVVNNNFSIEEALTFFDRVFSGNGPEITKNWEKFVQGL
ncbi:MAG: hypothetical protein EA412_00110 [Chitinophagaceae bacterium]|nr:MAG: hypothetical protein EA412_00110 [Chitinophagaceae bacterium]